MENVSRCGFTQHLMAVSIPPRTTLGFSLWFSSNGNENTPSQPDPNGTITLSTRVSSKLARVCSAEMTSAFANTKNISGESFASRRLIGLSTRYFPVGFAFGLISCIRFACCLSILNFPDQSYLSRFFKRYEGCYPTEYRNSFNLNTQPGFASLLHW